MPVTRAQRLCLRIAFLAAAALLAVGTAAWLLRPRSHPAHEHLHPEPQPPDLLDLVVLEENAAAGRLVAQIVVHPRLDATAELEILSPATVAFSNGQTRRPLTLRRDTPSLRERLEVRAPAGQAAELRVQLRLLDARGQPTLTITRERTLAPPAALAAPARVPVIHTLPDGSRVVEYITPTNATSTPRRR